MLLVLTSSLIFCAIFLLWAGLRLGGAGFYFVDPFLLGPVSNITAERRRKGYTGFSPMSTLELLRRVYLCAAIVPPLLILFQMAMSFL